MDKKESLNPMPDGRQPHPAEGSPTGAGCGSSEKGRPGFTLATLRRYGPLAVIGAAMLLVLAMGWHREVTLENIVAQRDRFHHVLDAHMVLSVVV
jgi:hypothetical protein